MDIPLSVQRLENSRNFVNKLWNVGKYITHAQAQIQIQAQLLQQQQQHNHNYQTLAGNRSFIKDAAYADDISEEGVCVCVCVCACVCVTVDPPQ